jgi:hypothetical protein
MSTIDAIVLMFHAKRVDTRSVGWTHNLNRDMREPCISRDCQQTSFPIRQVICDSADTFNIFDRSSAAVRNSKPIFDRSSAAVHNSKPISKQLQSPLLSLWEKSCSMDSVLRAR